MFWLYCLHYATTRLSTFQYIVSAPSQIDVITGMFVPWYNGMNYDNKVLLQAVGIVGAVIMPHNLYLHSALVKVRIINAIYYDYMRLISQYIWNITYFLVQRHRSKTACKDQRCQHVLFHWSLHRTIRFICNQCVCRSCICSWSLRQNGQGCCKYMYIYSN